MGAFDTVTLKWGEKAYAIPPRAVLGAIARIEEHLTFSELLAYGQRKTVPIGRLAGAYGSLLRYAGAEVTDDEVYQEMFGGGNGTETMLAATTTLMEMMVPKTAIKEPVRAPGEKGVGKPTPGKRKASADKASKRTSRSR